MISPASRCIRCINSRAVVDLPQPDSPTIPTVSPLAIENDTSSTARTILRALNRSPRTGKCLVNPLTCSSGCAAPPRSSTGSSISTKGLIWFMASIPDVHGAAHSVAEQVEADRHRENHGAGQFGHPWIDVDRGAQRVEHQTPFRLRWFGSEAQERQARRQDHRYRDEAGRVNKNRPQYIAEHVHAHDGEGAGAGCPRRLDEIHIPHAGGDALGNAGDLRHEHHREGHDGIDDARTENARNRDRKQHRGKCVEHVDGAHDRGIDLPADIAGDETERRSDDEGKDHGENADQQGQAPAIDQTRQHIAAEFVGAERIIWCPDMAEAANHRSLIRVGEPKPRRAQGGKKNRDQNAGANHADLVAYDAAADRRPVTARLGGGLCLGLESRVRQCAHRADTHLLQLRLIRGSIAACATSTMRFKNTKNSANTRIVPCNSGRSRWKIAELSNSPEPGHENTVSIRIEPPSMYPS